MILVTGATGHIGNVLVRELIKKGEKVRAMVIPRDDLTPLKDQEIELCIGDVLDPASLMRAMRGVDTVYHLAGIISILPGDNELLRRVNLEGTRNMLVAARRQGVRRFVYTSSIHALAHRPHGETVVENAGFLPGTTVEGYDTSKALASLEVRKAADEGLDAVIVCPTGVIGPYDYKLSELGTLILNALKKRAAFSIEGAYDFVDVRDVAQGEILAGTYGRKGETYILSGEWIKIHDILQVVRGIVNKKGPILKIPTWLAKAAANFTPYYYQLIRSKPQFTRYSIDTVQSNAVVSHEKATRELGYQPRGIRQALADTVHWLNEDRKMQEAWHDAGR
jgi:dihydroflavonol-4-reductase